MEGENPEGGGEVDLFGAPVTQIRERWGRPSFAKNKENQRLVALLAAQSKSHEEIARRLGCDPKTLRKNFSRELSEGAEIVEAEAMQVLYQQMRKGHVPSIRLLLERLDRARAAVAARRARAAAQAEPKLGLKAARTKAAHEAPGEWGDLVPETPIN